MEPMSMLNVLAEIASEKLQTDPAVIMITKAEKGQNSVIKRKSSVSHLQQNSGKQMTLFQISSLSESSILRLFTVSQANELKRKFYFTCRLIPLQCEETFHSFGSEDKAQNLMKKHLKKHLHDLLEKFKDKESQENYILHTVEKSSRNISQGDFRCISKRQNSANKSELKTKFINEKENSSVDITAGNAKTQIICNKPNMTPSCTSNSVRSFSSLQSCTPTPVAKGFVEMTLGSKEPFTLSEDKSFNECGDSFINKKKLKETMNSQSLSSMKRIMAINTNPTKNKTFTEQKVNKSMKIDQSCATFLINSDIAVCGNSPPIEQNPPSVSYVMNRSVDVAPLELKENCHSYLNNVDLYQSSKCSSVINFVGAIETSPTKPREVIEIKKEENIKLELLDLDQQYKITTNVSHDHGYLMSGDSFTHFQVEKEEVVESSDHSQHQEFIFESTRDSKRHAVSDFHSDTEKKSHVKGKGKFIGQSKDEKEMALTLIDKFKSQPMVQDENFQCNICKPPRVFTAHSTLVSHYKSHAGIRPYVCSLCQAVFTRQHSLNYHLLIHSNQTRFTCDDCGRKFRHPSHFKEHRRRHTGESPYECTDCLMRFKTRNTYKRHLRTRHGKKLTTKGSIHSVTEDPGTPKIPMEISSNIPNKQECHPNQKTMGNRIAVMDSSHQPLASNNSGVHNTDVAGLALNQNGIWCQEIIDFNSKTSVSTCTKELSESDCFHFNVKEECPTVPQSKQYHELMPPDIPKFEGLDDHILSAIGLTPKSPSSKEAAPHPDATVSTTRNQVLHTIQCSESSSNVSLQHVEQEPGSTISLRNTGDGILLILNDDEPVSPLENITPNTLLNHRINNSKIAVSTALSSGKNDKSQFITSGVNGFVSGAHCSRLLDGETSVKLAYWNHPRVSQTESKTIFSIPNQKPEEKAVIKGSILNSLLTSGPDRRHFTPPAKLQLSASVTVDVEGRPSSSKFPVEHGDGTDKWDSLMREVVSLSSAVKLRPDSQSQTPSAEMGSITLLRNDLNDEDVRIPTRDAKDVYVLKYINGTRVGKVFKAKPHFNTGNSGRMIPSGDPSNSKHLSVASSLKNGGKIIGSATIGPLESLR